MYDVNYVIKVDDDSYVRLDRLSIAVSQWANMGAGVLRALSTPDSSGQRMCSLRSYRHAVFTLHDDGCRYASFDVKDAT